MKVSVSMITYNHEKFIAQAIDSVLMQKVNFDYEIVIGEDCSTDNTRDIVIEYQKRYPDKICLLLPERNLGGRKNFVQTHRACQGEYIASLDGDDYWTSPYKLQKQVDFLDSHPECALCFHSVKMVFEDGSREPRILFPPGRRETYHLEDLLKKNFVWTSSVVFRNRLFDEFPDWFCTLPMGDWPFYILNAQCGSIGYINKVMGVYRIHSGGLWSMAGDIRNSQGALKFYKVMNPYFDFRYDRIIRAARYFHYHKMAKANGDGLGAFVNLLKCIITSPFNPAVLYRESLINMLELFPPAYNLLKSWQSKLRAKEWNLVDEHL